MRIALFHNAPSGGAKRSIYEWVQRLALNHTIDVYTLSTGAHSFCDIRPFVRQHRVFDFTPYRLFSSPWGRLNQLQNSRNLKNLTRIGYSIAVEIDSGDYDVVFANTCIYTFIPSLLQFVKRGSVYYLHEPFGKKFYRPIQRPYLQTNSLRQTLDRLDPLISLYRRRLATVQNKSVRRTKRLLANSQFTKEQMQLAFGVATPVCYCGVNCDDFRPITNVAKEDYVLSVGELSPRKGFDFIVESIGKLPFAHRPKLVLASNSVQAAERTYIEQLAAQKQVSLQILTRLNTEELVMLYNQARMCVYAPVMEPFGLVPLEAMSCATPVIGVREGGVKESIVHEQTGLLVERDPDQFAAAIQHLWADPELVLEFGRAGRAHVLAHWTWDQSVASLEKHLIDCSNKN